MTDTIAPTKTQHLTHLHKTGPIKRTGDSFICEDGTLFWSTTEAVHPALEKKKKYSDSSELWSLGAGREKNKQSGAERG